MRAYVLSIGSELLDGHLTDTNATFLAQELRSLGIELLHVIQCGDDRERLSRAIATAAADADLVVCTGGIGPTEDDLTREAIADVVGEIPVVSEPLADEIRAFFTARGLVMPDRNVKQAWIIPSNDTLPNPVGTAPGWFVDKDGTIIVAMPGVPREMKRMWAEQALPRIQDRLDAQAFCSTTVKTIGIGESALEDSISDLVARPNPIVATYAKDDGVQVRITGVGADMDSACESRNAALAELQSRLSGLIYGYDTDTLPGVITQQLKDRGLAISIVDHGGGGAFAGLLLADPVANRRLANSVAVPADGASAEELSVLAAAGDNGIARSRHHHRGSSGRRRVERGGDDRAKCSPGTGRAVPDPCGLR